MNWSGVFFFFFSEVVIWRRLLSSFFWLVWSSRGKLTDDPDPQASLGDRFWRSPGHVMQSYHICNPSLSSSSSSLSLSLSLSLSTFSWFPHLNILFYHPNSTRRLICSLRQVFFLSFFVVSFSPTTHLFFIRKKERGAGRFVDFPLSFH